MVSRAVAKCVAYPKVVPPGGELEPPDDDRVGRRGLVSYRELAIALRAAMRLEERESAGAP